MKREAGRILTTHAGSLPRSEELMQAVFARAEGRPYDRDALAKRLKSEVAEVVRKQIACGVDSVNDGEVGKTNFNNYVRERLAGFEARPVRAGQEPAAAVHRRAGAEEVPGVLRGRRPRLRRLRRLGAEPAAGVLRRAAEVRRPRGTQG